MAKCLLWGKVPSSGTHCPTGWDPSLHSQPHLLLWTPPLTSPASSRSCPCPRDSTLSCPLLSAASALPPGSVSNPACVRGSLGMSSPSGSSHAPLSHRCSSSLNLPAPWLYCLSHCGRDVCRSPPHDGQFHEAGTLTIS